MTNSKLEMLSAREQLMEDIDCIIDGFLYEKLTATEQNDLVMALCDAVCKNFPSN